MSHEERIKQIQNGLQIVDMVKKIREELPEKPTYGRSAIGLPTTKDRTAAWELFHQLTSDGTGSEELLVQEGNGDSKSRNELGIPDDLHNPDCRGDRTYKESKWDEGDEPVLENKLASNLQSNDTRRETADRKSDHTYVFRQDHSAEGSRKSDGRTSAHKIDVSFVLTSNIPKDAITSGTSPGEKPKHVMNPNAQEYVPQAQVRPDTPRPQKNPPLITINEEDLKCDEIMEIDDIEESTKPKVPPRMIRHMKKDKLDGKEDEVLNLTIQPKQRKPIADLSEIDADPEPIKLPSSIDLQSDDTDSDEQSERIEDIDKSNKGSTDSVFGISRSPTDNDRRNMMAAKAISNIIKGAIREGRTDEEIIYLTEGPSGVAGAKTSTSDGKKLRALGKTKAGKTGDEQDPKVVKKGIEGNSVYLGMDPTSGSKSGAIHSAPKSCPPQQKRSAHVNCAPISARTKNVLELSMNEGQSDTRESGLLDESFDSAESMGFEEYFDKLTSQIKSDDLLKEIYRNQLIILSKFNDDGEQANFQKLVLVNQKAILAKIDALDRNISRLGLAISSMEQMLASMRIMIPGKPIDSDTKERNPSLKPVISRDTLRSEEVIDINPDNTLPRTQRFSAKKELFIEPLDPSKTNATQFIPENDNVTIRTLTAIVNNRIKDPELKKAFHASIREARTPENIKHIHDNIKEALNAGL